MRKVAATTFILAWMLAPMSVIAEGKLETAIESVSTAVQVAPAADAKAPTAEIGLAASEALPGNGTRAGYVLGHGSVVAGSEYVSIGAHHATRNRDYTIDYDSGTLFFTEPVRQMDSVQVSYRYSEKAKGERNVTGPGALGFKFGNGLQMNFLYAYRAADPNQGPGAPDILTYGVNSTTKLGSSSSLSSMMYFATPQESGRVSLNATQTVPGRSPAKVKKDRMMVQNADLGLGKVRLRLGFQDVGEDFAGFRSLRDSNAAATDVLNQLEKEKGLKRMSFAADVPSGSGSAFSFSMGQISDKNDDISTRAFGYSSDKFKFNFGMREVGRGFARFKDLREQDRAQMAAESGMKRTNYGMQFRSAMTTDKKPVWSSLSMTQLKSDQGSLSFQSAALDFGRVKIDADIRSMDPTFNRMAALNDEERTRMALIARRQFNPKAQVAEVTAADKAKINSEAGLDRSNYIVQVDGGPLSTWLTLSSVDSQQGGLNRSAVKIDGRAFSVSFSHQNIDESFKRLSSLQPMELANYGNEYGMSRSRLDLALKLAGGDASLQNAVVTDHQGAGVLRRILAFNSPRLKFRANFQDIDPLFSRIMDLSDSDRSLLAKDRGFNRADYSINFQAMPNLNIDSYIYDSTNDTAGQTRDQRRHKITYTPQRGPQVTLFKDDYGYVSDTGVLSAYSRQKITFDRSFQMLGGLLFKSLSDVTTTHEGDGRPITTTIDQRHLESNQSARTSFTLDTLDIDYGDGRFENTKATGFKTSAGGRLSLTASYATVDRDADRSEASGSFGFEWALRKDLKMTMAMSNRDGGPKGSQQTRQFSLNGLLAKRFLLFNDVRVGSAMNTSCLTGRQVGCDNAFKLEAGILGGSLLFDNTDKLNPKNGIYYTSRIFQYQSDKDPKKWYHLTFFRQNLIAPNGLPAEKRNYALDMRLSPATNLTLTSYSGKDGQNGAVLPIGGTVFKLSHRLSNGLTLVADHTVDSNEQTLRRARITGLGFLGTLSNKAAVEFYYGLSKLLENGISENTNVFRIKYDRKVDADHYLTITAQKKSGVDRSTINPFEGNTVARIDFRTVFN